MILILLALILLFLYAVIAAYPTAQNTFHRLYWHEEEEKTVTVPQIILRWLESPSHEEHFPIFMRGIKILLLSAEGALLITWLSNLSIQTWLTSHLPISNLVFYPWIVPLCNILFILIFVFMLLLAGEFLPEKLALLNPEAFLVFGFPFISIFYSIFFHLISAQEKLANLFFNKKQKETIQTRNAPSSSFEIREIVNDPQTASDLPALEREILSAVINFNDMLVNQVTIPRTEMIAVESQVPLRQALDLCLEKGVTKLPVYIDHLDNIEGIVHLRDLVIKIQQDPDCNLPAISLIRETLFVPEAVPLHTLLHQFRSQHMHMAIVLDEFGGTAGVVTLEDLLEEVFGEIMDPFETISPNIQVLKDGSFLIDGRTTIDDFNKYFNLKLVIPAYQTIAGYVLDRLNRIPQAGDSFEDPIHNLLVTVKSMDRLRIEKVLVQFYLSPALGKPAQSPMKTKPA